MTAIDPLGAVASSQQQAQAPAPQPMQMPDVTDPIWSQTLATIGGLMGGDNYGSTQMTQPDYGGMPLLSVDQLNQMSMGNEQQQQTEQAIAAENRALNAQNAVPGQGGGAPAPAAGGSGNWVHDILAGIGAPDTPENERALIAWQKAEGGGGVAGGPTPSNYNWLNTTENWPGAVPINSVGVKSYASYQDGIAAIVKNLTGGHYQNILDALHAGNDAFAVARAIANSPFGTGNGVINVLNAQGSHARLQ